MICPGMCWVRIIMDGRWNGFANGACSLFERQLFWVCSGWLTG
jgi:hypothetical protein